MGNATSWLAQSLCPEEQALWVAAKSGDLAALRAGLARLTPETRYYAEWRDPVFGASPLANACAQGHLACVRELVAAGVDCNARDLQGNAPLHVAARAGKSEVVKQLLDTLAVDYFAKTTHRSQSALDIARHECRQATDGDAHKFIQCIEMIEKKICIHTGWLYQRADNLLSLAAGMSSLTSWKKRYCMVLRTENPNVVEIDLFPMRPGEKRPPCPSMELIFRASDGVQESSDITWLSHKQYRFAISAYSKSGINRVSAPQLVDFAASTQEELSAWKMFFANLRLNGSSQVANLYSAAAAARFADTTNYDDATSRQEQRDIERALRLSMQDARRNPRAQTAAALPSAPSFGGSSGTSAQTVVGPDGVEIVQQFGSYSDGHEPPVPIDASAATDRARDEDEGSGECVICFDGPQAAVCVPCGHNAICMDCAQELLDTTRQCPVCRQTVREVIKLYRV